MKEYHCSGMEITYRFESSDEIYTVQHVGVECAMSTFVDTVLKNIFGDDAPSCYLEATNTEDKVITRRTTFPIIFRRTYKKLFTVEEKKIPSKSLPSKRIPPPPPYPPPPLRRKKRWRSRSPVHRRPRNPRHHLRRFWERW